MLVNAAGPWVGELMSERLGLPDDAPVRLVKGSHIVVPKHFEHDRAYIFQNADGRIIFAIPYEHDFTLIGTTDRDYRRRSRPNAITRRIRDLPISAPRPANISRKPVRRSDIVWTYAGVRPLYDDGASEAQEATRDYVLKVEGGGDVAPLLNIYRRQDHHLPPARRGRAGKARALLSKVGRAVDRRRAAAGRRFPVDGLRRRGRRS